MNCVIKSRYYIRKEGKKYKGEVYKSTGAQGSNRGCFGYCEYRYGYCGYCGGNR